MFKIFFIIAFDYFSVRLFLVVSRQNIHQRDGRILHIVHERVDLRNDIVVEQLKNNRRDKTHEGRQQGDLDTACNQRRTPRSYRRRFP